jgi:DNA-binding response OmpR family regulator
LGNGSDSQIAEAQVLAVEPMRIAPQPITPDAVVPERLPVHPLATIPVAYSLLILSRDPAIRKLLCKLLSRPGYHTHQLAEVAHLPSELLARKVDVLVVDLDEPEQEGLERLSTLRANFPNLKIVALSGLDAPSIPGSIVLPKPFRRELLIESVQSLLVDAASACSRDVSAHA